jgi:hypothetical protein
MSPTPVIHIQSPHHPGRSCCDPRGEEREGLRAPDLPLVPGLGHCPETLHTLGFCPDCVVIKRAIDRAAEHAAMKLPRIS